MIRTTILAAILAAPLACLAGIDTDKDAGTCAGALTAARSDEGAAQALRMADDMNRAAQFAANWLRDLGRMPQEQRTAPLYLATRACDRVGVDFGKWTRGGR